MKVNSDIAEQIEQLENQEMWESCNRAIEEALARFENQGIELKVQEYLFTILLANPQNAYTIMNEGYCGDGGIPGYATGYYLIKYYLEKTGVPIEKATIIPATEILNEVKEFWK